MNTPIVSIIMPAFNQAEYIREAIDSILSQAFIDFELIIVNDASTDTTLKIIESFTDERIKIITNQENLGITKSLNIGVRTAQGKFIARMDADDISEPERLSKQINSLNENPGLAVVGSAITIIDAHGKEAGKKIFPLSPPLTKWKLLFGFALAHPSIMAQAEIMKNNLYDESYINSQDYELWSRLVFQGNMKLSNLPDYLLKYREHDGTASKNKPIDRIERSANIGVNNIKKYYQLNRAEEKLVLRARFGQLKFRELGKEKKLVKKIADNFIQKENLTKKEKKQIKKFACSHFWFNLKVAIKKTFA